MVNPILVIIGINLVIFILVRVSSGLVYDLALHSSFGDFLSHPWGLFTSMFVHYEMFHLFANMLTLYFFGSFLIRLVGEKWFWIIYIGGGLLGNALFVLMTLNALAIGASGAVFALAGTLVILAPRLKVFIFPIPAPVPLWIAVIGGFLLMSFFPDVAWQAHLGGMLFGLAIGYYLSRRRGRRFYF